MSYTEVKKRGCLNYTWQTQRDYDNYEKIRYETHSFDLEKEILRFIRDQRPEFKDQVQPKNRK